MIFPEEIITDGIQLGPMLQGVKSGTWDLKNGAPVMWPARGQNRSSEIEVINYDAPPEHAYQGTEMSFYGAACDTYSGPENVINTVVTTRHIWPTVSGRSMRLTG